MFTGVSMEKAVKAWQNGRDVRVLDRDAEDCAGNIPLGNLLKGYEFLVDVPAVDAPEFKETVEGMAAGLEIALAQGGK